MPDTPKQNTKPKALRDFDKACIGLVLLFVAGVLLTMWHFHAWKTKLIAENKAMLAQLRAEGYPTTLQELDDSYRIPPGPNGADLWNEAFRLLPEYDDIPNDIPLLSCGTMPDMDTHFSKKQLIQVNNFLTKHENLLTAIHRAAAQDSPCRFPVDFHDGYSQEESEHLTHLRKTMSFLMLSVATTLSDNPPDGLATTKTTIKTMQQATRSIENEPDLMAFLNRLIAESFICETIQRIALSNRLYWVQLSQTIDISHFTQDRNRLLKTAILCDAIWGFDVYEAIASPHETKIELFRTYTEKFKHRNIDRVMTMTGHFAEDKNFFIKQKLQLLAACNTPPHKRIEYAKTFSAKPKVQSGIYRYRDISNLLLGAPPSSFEFDVKILAAWRTLHTAVAVERYRQEKGALPATLAELLPAFLDAVPLDPFDGKPLRYTITTPGFVVYSVGENLTDDGGKDATFPKTISHKPDIIFVVPH